MTLFWFTEGSNFCFSILHLWAWKSQLKSHWQLLWTCVLISLILVILHKLQSIFSNLSLITSIKNLLLKQLHSFQNMPCIEWIVNIWLYLFAFYSNTVYYFFLNLFGDFSVQWNLNKIVKNECIENVCTLIIYQGIVMKVINKNIDLYIELIPINAFITLSKNSNFYIHHQNRSTCQHRIKSWHKNVSKILYRKSNFSRTENSQHSSTKQVSGW